MFLAQAKNNLETEIKTIKETLEQLHANDAVPSKQDCDVLYDDGSTRKIRLQRKRMGSYFSVLPDFKDEFSGEKHKLEAKYLKAGKAEEAEKSATWVAQEVK